MTDKPAIGPKGLMPSNRAIRLVKGDVLCNKASFSHDVFS